MTINEAVRELRSRLDMNESEFAANIGGISAQDVSRYEDDRIPGPLQLLNLVYLARMAGYTSIEKVFTDALSKQMPHIASLSSKVPSPQSDQDCKVLWYRLLINLSAAFTAAQFNMQVDGLRQRALEVMIEQPTQRREFLASISSPDCMWAALADYAIYLYRGGKPIDLPPLPWRD